jgi:hypothetical protein
MSPEVFARLLDQHQRIVIAGGPRCGKTTLASLVTDRFVLATDDYMNLPWADVPNLINAKLVDMPAFVLEGVQAGRCLRKGLKVDCVIWLSAPMTTTNKAQRSMAKGIEKVFNDWLSLSPEHEHMTIRA